MQTHFRRSLSLLVVAVVFTLPATAQNHFDYTITNGTVTITGYNGPGGALLVPETINGRSVTAIASAAFQNKTNLNTVVIPDSVTHIGSNAFSGCSWLFGVTMPKNVTDIAAYAFYRCFQLVDIIIPEGATNIGTYAFYDCASLRDISIPDSVISIERSAFERCWRLGKVVVGNGVLTIGDWAFYRCGGLTNLIIGSAVRNIGLVAFDSCTNLATVTIPKSVTAFGPRAFGYCSRLRAIYFAGNAPTVYEPFSGTEKLTVYYLPGTTGWSTTMNYRPTVLWNPRVHMRSPGAGVGSNGFGFTITGSSELAILVEACTNLANPAWFPVGTNTLLAGASYFNDPAWTNASSRFYRQRPAWPPDYDFAITNGTITLTRHLGAGGHVDIPATINGLPVTSIGEHAFWRRTDLTSVTIPDTVTSITSLAFSGCVNLTNVVLGQNVRTLSGAFYDCGALTSVTIPAAVTNISEAFERCFSLTALIVDAGNLVYSSVDGVVFDKAHTTLVRYPTGRAGSYNLPHGITKIDRHAFRGCNGLTNVTIPESVTDIGDFAFSECRSLDSARIPNAVTNLGVLAFFSCDTLRSVTIGSNVTSIGQSAFSGCDNLTSVTIPDSATEIGRAAFNYCIRLANVVIGNGITNIAANAFQGCWNLDSVTVGRNVSSLGQSAFGFCSALKEILFTGNAPAAPDGVFVSVNVTVYYLPGTTGWGPTFSGRPTALWDP